VVLVVLGLLTAFFFFFSAGSWLRGHGLRPRPHASASVHGLAASPVAGQTDAPALANRIPNQRMQQTRFGRLDPHLRALGIKR